MKITKVSNPKGVIHYHNGQRYDLEGNFLKLTASDVEFFSLPEETQKHLRDRWSRVCQVNNRSMDCYLEPKDRWSLFRQIVGDTEFNVELFNDYVSLTKHNRWEINGRRAWTLIAVLFRANRNGQWPFMQDGSYSVKRDYGIFIKVPGPVFGTLLATDGYQQRLEKISEQLGVVVNVSFPK